MFSANPSISSTRLKPLDVAKGRRNGVKLGRNGVRLEGERGWIGEGTGSDKGGRGRTGGKWDRNGGGTGLDWGEMESEWGGTRSD